MVAGAERFAGGDLAHRLPIPDSQELSVLARTLNRMASELEERIRAITRERNERQAILSSMIEGVIVVDAEQRVVELNRTAARWLRVDAEAVEGRTLPEAVRNADLLRFVTRTLSGEGPLEEDLVIHNGAKRFLQLHGTLVRDADDRRIGALVVLHDVTRLRRLETMRRDFVANVSHEIRTPITSIKGFAETLQGGSTRSPDDVNRFLGIIAKEADRVSAVVEDLLTLARIEDEAERAQLALEEGNLRDFLEAAVEACRKRAARSSVELELACPDDLTGRINPSLLEQAVVNLIDNAIKYSPAGETVRVEAMIEADEIHIRVGDRGCGIEAEHLPRIFERFYRVDKARSRELGGTGLGLAIVKHIAQAHDGQVTVESTPDAGSLFTIRIPRL
jgi:two-component system phosphate regulon sensor histidine kinase PhoR